MKIKWFVAIAALLIVAVLIVPTIIRSSDPASIIEKSLEDQGITQVVGVHVGKDRITEFDNRLQPISREPQQTVEVDVRYKTSWETNENYGAAIAAVQAHLAEYKKTASAEYVKINIYRNSDLVAYLAYNEKNERSAKVLDQEHISIIGMGMSMPPQAYQQQKKLEKDVKAKGL